MTKTTKPKRKMDHPANEFGDLAAGRTIPLMIDSGAFSAERQKKPIALDDYIAFIKENVHGVPGVVYVNLDIIGDGKHSYDNWIEMRAAGLDPLPVFHVTTDERWLKKYLHYTDHVGLGGLVKFQRADRFRTEMLDRLWLKWFVDSNRMPKIKVHGFGLTSFSHMLRYPWYSIDSTSWLVQGMYGKMYWPRRKDGRWLFEKRPDIISGSCRHSRERERRRQHMENVNPQERAQLEEYLKYIGLQYGKTKIVDGKEVIIEEGVSNNREMRLIVNVIYFLRHVQSLPWPRPLKIRATGRLI